MFPLEVICLVPTFSGNRPLTLWQGGLEIVLFLEGVEQQRA